MAVGHSHTTRNGTDEFPQVLAGLKVSAHPKMRKCFQQKLPPQQFMPPPLWPWLLNMDPKVRIKAVQGYLGWHGAEPGHWSKQTVSHPNTHLWRCYASKKAVRKPPNKDSPRKERPVGGEGRLEVGPGASHLV